MDGGAWWATVHGVAKSWTQLSDFTFTFHFSIDLELLFNAFILNHIAKIQELQIKITILAFVFTYVATFISVLYFFLCL